MKAETLKRILSHHISVILAKQSSGKTTLLCDLIDTYRLNKGTFDVWTYGLKPELTEKLNTNVFYNLEKLETLQNSLIIVDEVGSLFELENRKKRKQIETTLRLIAHNNNKLILCGLPFDFKKFVCELATCFMYKAVFVDSLVNGSQAKKYLNTYSGSEKGSHFLNLPTKEVLIYDGLTCDWFKDVVKYKRVWDTKRHNQEPF